MSIKKELSRAVIIASVLLFSFCALNRNADEIFTNGHVVTLNEDMREAEAFAVGNGRIVAVGTNQTIRNEFAGVKETDLQGKTVMPGIIEAHGHLVSLGRTLMELNVEGFETPESIVQMVKERVEVTPPGEWILGWGWDEGAWSGNYPTNKELSAVSPDNPVWLRGLHSFAGWGNAKAFEIAEITKDTPNPENGEILTNRTTGIPTGILTNEAQVLLTKFIPPFSSNQLAKAIELAIDECLKHGLTTIHEFGITSDELDILQILAIENRLKSRIYGILSNDETLIEPFLKNGPQIDPEYMFSIRGIKVFIDGALGSRGAALSEPYSDASDTKGLLTTSEADLYHLTKRALEAGMQVSTHAIGDYGNRVTLDAYKAALHDVPGVIDPRLRIEHAQVVALEDISRFAEMNIISSMQPPHATSDMPWAENRIGSERIKGAYAWRLFLDAGVHVPLSSDFPGETLNPFWGMYAAETRQNTEGEPDGGWYPGQRLTREEVLNAYTFEAAYAGFEEEIKGKIAPGRLADFIIISDDILTIKPKDLLSLIVEKTYVGGVLVYSKNQ